MPEQQTGQKTGLVVTAHPGDFVWRAGGAIALHAKGVPELCHPLRIRPKQ